MRPYRTYSKPTYIPQNTHVESKQENIKQNLPLHIYVERALNTYLVDSGGQPITELYNTLLAAIEPPLLKVTFKFCKTQQEAARMLGLSRGTLRKKIKQYHFKTE